MSNLSDVVGGADLFNGTNYSYTTDRLNNLNSSIYFNSGFLSVPPSGAYCTGGDFTITAWIQMKSSKKHARIIEFGNGPYSDSVIFGGGQLNTQLFFAVILNSSSTSSLNTPTTYVIELNIWYHVAAVLQGQKAYIYINGIQVANGPMQRPRSILRKENYIGRSNYHYVNLDDDADAVYDDIKLFKGALKSTDIMNDYTGYKSLTTLSTSSSTTTRLSTASNLNSSIQSCSFGSYGKNCELKSNSTIFKNLTNEQSLNFVNLFGFSFNTTWSLIYKASVDGFSANSFHSKCNGNLNGTLTLVSTNNFSNIFGGYTQADWSGSSYKGDANAFLFSLVNAFNTAYKMPIKSIFNGYAIYANPDYGPVFGSCMDFYITKNGSYGSYSNCAGAPLYTYQYPSLSSQSNYLGGSNTTPDEIEVYARKS